MASLLMADIARIDLNSPLVRTNAGRILATGDDLAHRFGVKVKRGNQPVSMAGYGVTGYFIRPDETTVVLVGATEDDMAFVDFSEECYAYDGQFALAIKISMDGSTRTVRIVDGIISRTQTDSVVAPGESIPTLDDLFAQIAAVEAATEAAKKATAETVAATAEIREAAQELSASTAPPIIPTAASSVICITDSAARVLDGFSIFGRTTQAGTPTPSAPVPLVNIGSGGTVTVTATGKNLLPDTEVTDQFPGGTGNVYTAATTSGVAVIGTVRLLAGVTYTLSATRVSGSGSLPCLILRAADGTNFESNYGHTAVPVTYTPSADVDATVLIQGNGGNTSTTIGDSYAVQLEIGSAATSFEAYKDGGSASFSTPNGLPGIPVSSGGSYTDENGQQWICDEIIWPEMRYVQRVVRLTGFTKQNNYGSTDAYVSVSDYPLLGGSAGVGLCNVTNVYKYNTLDEIHFYMSDSRAVVFVPTDFTGSIEVLAALAEPIETTPELVIYQSLASKYPHTTILNDGGAGMKASYVADTKNYIDQRIAAIAAAMINA